MTFTLTINYERKSYRLKVEQISFEKEGMEVYKVSSKTSTVTLQSNRPMLRAKGLKKKAPHYKAIEGGYKSASILYIIKEELTRHLDEL